MGGALAQSVEEVPGSNPALNVSILAGWAGVTVAG